MSINTAQFAIVGFYEAGSPLYTGHETQPIPKYDRSQRIADKVEYVGTTLCDREENYYDDSDGYSHVWHPERGIIRVGTWTTRAHSDTAPGKVDAYDPANPHRDAMVEAHVVAIAKVSAARNVYRNRSILAEAFTPAKGDYVRVARGRKVPKGTEGTVIWTGERSYSQWQAKYGKADLRVGIKDAAGNVHWTDAKNVDMVDEPVYALLSEDETAIAAAIRAINPTLEALHREYCSAVASLAYI